MVHNIHIQQFCNKNIIENETYRDFEIIKNFLPHCQEAIRYAKVWGSICKETVSEFEPMTNKLPKHNFIAAPGLTLPLQRL